MLYGRNNAFLGENERIAWYKARMWPFSSSDPQKQKEKKFRELEKAFSGSAEMIAVQKATWLSSRGNSLGERGKLEEAIQGFEEAIRIKNDHIPSHFSLGIAYEKKGMHEQARPNNRESARRNET
jgi:tetratricopeptide (TPR) repeat protein